MTAGPYLFPPIGGFGNPASPWTYNDVNYVIDLQAHDNKALLLKVELKDITSTLTFGPYGPAGTLDALEWSWSGATIVLWPGATVARSSQPDDAPANTWVNDTMETSVNFGRSAFDSADPRNNSTTTQGIIELIDPKGDLEFLFNYSWDGAKITIYRGADQAYFSTYGEAAKFTGSAIIGDLNKKTIRAKDLGWKLEGLIHDERYLGNGGIEGDESIQGKWKPYALGWFFNVEPVPVDTANEVFQWSWAPTDTVMAIQHGGVIITISADYPTYDDLIEAGIPTGQCATCKAKSLVRTNFDIAFGIRITGLGDSNVILGHSTPQNRSDCVRRVATGYGNSKLRENIEIDILAFASLSQDHPAEVGFWWGDETTKADALNQIMGGILGYWHVRPNGQFSVGYIDAPDSNASVADINYGDYGMGPIEMIDETLPWPGTLVTWRHNYSPQTRDQLAGSVQVDEATARILAAGYSVAPAGDRSVNQLYPTAKPITIEGNFKLEVDAFNQANRIQRLMGVPRQRYSLPMEIDAFVDLVDRDATFLNFNRLKLGSSKTLTCVSIDSLGFGAVTTEWWG